MYIIWREEDHAITRDPTTNKIKFARPVHLKLLKSDGAWNFKL